jgi:hypothetical protein
MAKATLPTNFKDDVLASAMGGKRRYNMIHNSDGTVSFEDVTDYTQVGSTFGAAQINATNTAVNNAADASKIIDSLDTIKANTQSGYIAGALAVKALSSNLKSLKIVQFETGGNGDYKTANIIFDVSDFSKLHIGAIGGIGSGNFAVYGGSGINIVNGITQSTLTNSATLETISDGGGTEKEYDISEYSYVRLYIKGTPSGYSYIKYMNDISFS